MLKTKTITNDEQSMNKPTPAAMAATVRISSAQQVAERRLRVLQEQRQAIRDEVRDLVSGDRSDKTVAARINKLHECEAELGLEIDAAKAEVRPLRQARAKQIEDLLAQRRREAAQDIQRGLALIRAGLYEVATIANAIELAGGSHMDLPLAFNASHVERVVDRYA